MAYRILVVDDDREIVRLLRAYLEKDGYRVLAAEDGARALQLVRSERPDLVLLDLMMPGKDGWEVTRIMRADPSLAQTPVIMLTARVEDQDKIVGLEIGADDYVVKPFNPREVLARVRAVLRRSRGEPVMPKVIEVGRLRIDIDGHEVQVAGQTVRLTPTEFSLLEALAEQPGRALTRMELIEKGLGYGYEGLDRTMDIVEMVQETSQTFTMLLGSIAAISLIVGGIGIMNIMLVSVTERTREIGIRKAVGARRRDILAQFLVEAVVMGLAGGVLGVAAGYAGAQVVTPLLGATKAIVTSSSVIMALTVSIAVGLFFGIYPAGRAAALNPIDALRRE